MRCLRSLICVLVVLAAAHVAAQQITGNLRGTVTDASGAVVQAATVTARQIETGLTRTAFTDSSGAYVLVELPVGRYSLKVSARGFQEYVQEGISLDVNETATVPVRLAVGTETERVQVMADAQLIQSTGSSLGQTVMEREILDLPLDGRNFSQLGLLQPGVVPLTPGLKEAGGPGATDQAYSVDGQRPESNNFLIDGADNVSAVDGGFVLKPPIDAIAEFRILTSQRECRVRTQHRLDDQHRHAIGHEFISRGAVGISAQRCDGCVGFLHAHGSAPEAEPVRRDLSAGRSSRTRRSSSRITRASATGRERRVPATVPSLCGTAGKLCAAVHADEDLTRRFLNRTLDAAIHLMDSLSFFGPPPPHPVRSRSTSSALLSIAIASKCACLLSHRQRWRAELVRHDRVLERE